MGFSIAHSLGEKGDIEGDMEGETEGDIAGDIAGDIQGDMEGEKSGEEEYGEGDVALLTISIGPETKSLRARSGAGREDAGEGMRSVPRDEWSG